MTKTFVYDNIVDAIGNTPLVRLNSVIDGLDTNIYVKLEYLNPGGSIKDRIGSFIIEEAEQSGRLKPGGVKLKTFPWEVACGN